MGVRWTYLGPEGTFTEQAARLLARQRQAGCTAAEVTLVAVSGVSAALEAVRNGDVDGACVALESSVEGAVPLTQDELTLGAPLMITAEAYVPVTFDLLVRPGTTLGSVRTVGAHPHGHAQVRDWLSVNLPAGEAIPMGSNAAAAAAVHAGELDAAAAAPAAAQRYGLIPIARDIGHVRDAVTRFVLLSRPGPPPAPTGNDRTSLVLSVDNTPGSLVAALTEFGTRGLNLTRLESRPTRNKLGEYVFPVDVDGHLSEPAIADVLGALLRRSMLHRWLGSYPRAHGTGAPLPAHATAQAYADGARLVGQWQRGEWA